MTQNADAAIWAAGAHSCCLRMPESTHGKTGPPYLTLECTVKAVACLSWGVCSMAFLLRANLDSHAREAVSMTVLIANGAICRRRLRPSTGRRFTHFWTMRSVIC